MKLTTMRGASIKCPCLESKRISKKHSIKIEVFISVMKGDLGQFQKEITIAGIDVRFHDRASREAKVLISYTHQIDITGREKYAYMKLIKQMCELEKVDLLLDTTGKIQAIGNEQKGEYLPIKMEQGQEVRFLTKEQLSSRW